MDIHPDVSSFLELKHGQVDSLKGTGIFQIPDPEKGIGKKKKILVKDLTYQETLARSMGCLKVSWCPDDVKSFNDISLTNCSGRCKTSGDCSIGCFCDPFSGCE